MHVQFEFEVPIAYPSVNVLLAVGSKGLSQRLEFGGHQYTDNNQSPQHGVSQAGRMCRLIREEDTEESLRSHRHSVHESRKRRRKGLA